MEFRKRWTAVVPGSWCRRKSGSSCFGNSAGAPQAGLARTTSRTSNRKPGAVSGGEGCQRNHGDISRVAWTAAARFGRACLITIVGSAASTTLRARQNEPRTTSMKIATIICTLNRPSVLHETVLSIMRQSLAPEQIVIASPESKHVLSETLAIPQSRIRACSRWGLETAQRRTRQSGSGE